MRRRIERSRARCEKAATNHKTDKDQEAESRSKPSGVAPLENNEKGS
jgi:hypothetical protein